MGANEVLKRLIAALTQLPGVGEKTATRLALYLLTCPEQQARELSQSIAEARTKIHFCQRCFNYAEADLCPLCGDARRRADLVCVVETPADLLSIERAGGFQGLYHVLHGTIAPLDGIGPRQLRIDELLARVDREQVREVILATNPTMNGNATAAYIADQLQGRDIVVTRIAQGIPAGSDIGYADRTTLAHAMQGRRRMD